MYNSNFEAYTAGYEYMYYPTISGCAYTLAAPSIVVSGSSGLAGYNSDFLENVQIYFPSRNKMSNDETDSITITFPDDAGNTVAIYEIDIER